MNDVSESKNIVEVKTPVLSQKQVRSGIGLSVNDISVTYDGVVAVSHASFVVAPGERIGILGNSGAGKSTLCDVISGIIRPDSGTIVLDGKTATKKSALWRANKGMRRTSAKPVIFDTLTLEENVIVGSPSSKGDGVFASLFFPRRFHKEKHETARQILEYCDVDSEENKHVDRVPYATKKKIELARSLMGNPRILILDEPATSMNATERAQYCQVVLDYVETFSTTLIIVENDIDIVRALCQRAIVFDAGEIIADGEVAAVLHNADVVDRYLGTGAKK